MNCPDPTLPLTKGDIAVLGAFMPHRSGAHPTSAMRKHLLVSDPDGPDPEGGRRLEHYAGLRVHSVG